PPLPVLLFRLLSRPRPGPTLFPYTPLFRSRGKVLGSDAHGLAIETQGLLRPRVFVGEAFAAKLSDDALASALGHEAGHVEARDPDRKSTRLNSSHVSISYAVFCLKKKKNHT